MVYLLMMKRAYRLTFVELIAIIIFATFTASILLYQKGNITASQKDNDRKTAINAMYYNLEEVFYKKKNYYPEYIDSDLLSAMDPALFTDPQGVMIGEPNSDYRYDGIDCLDDKCRSYKLIARLDKEADYIKTSRY